MANVDRNVEEKNLLVSCLSIVNKLFKRLVNNKLVDPENLVYFMIYSTILGHFFLLNLLFALADRIAGAFNKTSTTRVVALDLSRAFQRV